VPTTWHAPRPSAQGVPELGEVLVGRAVAVVVPTVATLGRAFAPRLATIHGRAVGVGPSRIAGVDHAFARHAGDRRVRQVAGVPAEPAVTQVVHEVGVLVGPPVAIVVQPVAELRATGGHGAGVLAAALRFSVGVTEARLARQEDAGTCFATEGAVRQAPAVVAAGAAVDDVLVEGQVVLVGAAVAIVVDPVAQLESALGDGAGRLAAGVGIPVEVMESILAGEEATAGLDADRSRIRQAARLVAGPAVLGIGLQVDVLVGRTVAILIEAVAPRALGA
jgi:hypothetical protein